MNLTTLLSIPLAISLLMPQSSNHTLGRKTLTNDNGLNGEFSLKNGPRFSLPQPQQALVDQVIEEVKKGYGGTLVTKKGPDMIAAPLGLSFEVWGIDAGKLPPTRLLTVSLESGRPTDRSQIIGQESWSNPGVEEPEYGVQFFRILGQRAPYSHVSMPPDRKDGVYFFSFNKRLYVWSKGEMDTGVLQMAKTAGLIDDAMWAQRASTQGLRQLKTTVTGQ